MVAPGRQLRTEPKPLSGETFAQRLREISMFFQGNDAVHQTMKRVATALDREHIAYAIVGGMAVNAHGHRRTTADVDFLLTSAGLDAFLHLVDRGEYHRTPGRPRRFIDPLTGTAFDILVTGRFPGSGQPGPVAFPDPSSVFELHDELRVVNITALIELKLAARRYQDFADVVNLIREKKLDESFAATLHPSVRTDFLSCVDEQRREADYEAREDLWAEGQQ